MAQKCELTTLADLLHDEAASEHEEQILNRLKLLAEENFPDGWKDWEVGRASKAIVLGENVEENVSGKLEFALPTVGLVRAFDPEANHLSEKGYRQIRTKLLDWAFTRALIIGPPAIANKIWGSAARTEDFKQTIAPMRSLLLSRTEADEALKILSESEATKKTTDASHSARLKETVKSVKRLHISRRKSDQILPGPSDSGSRKRPGTLYPIPAKKTTFDMLQEQCKQMVSDIQAKIEVLRSGSHMEVSFEEDSSDEETTFLESSESLDLDVEEELVSQQTDEKGIEFQSVGTERKQTQRKEFLPKYRVLSMNKELKHFEKPELVKQDTTLATITRGLLLQKKALIDGLKKIAKDHPTVAAEMRKLVAMGSQYRTISDNLLQFVCEQRAEAMELRRKSVKTRFEALTAALHQIPSSKTHLFDEALLAGFIKENGGTRRIFGARNITSNALLRNRTSRP